MQIYKGVMKMSKNPLYANEVATAHQFVIEHNTDIKLQNFLYNITRF